MNLTLVRPQFEPKSILHHQNPSEKLKGISKIIKDVFYLIPSTKHMNGMDLGRLESTPALQYKM
jgi:hypothetical protein